MGEKEMGEGRLNNIEAEIAAYAEKPLHDDMKKYGVKEHSDPEIDKILNECSEDAVKRYREAKEYLSSKSDEELTEIIELGQSVRKGFLDEADSIVSQFIVTSEFKANVAQAILDERKAEK